MKKMFLETNAITRAQEEGIDGKKLREMLGSKGYLPVVGFHTIYELAKTFLNIKKIEIAKNFFEILKSLRPDYTEESKEILHQEYQHYLKGTVIIPFTENGKREDIEKEIVKLSNGIFDERARDFIQNRDKNFKPNHILISTNNIQWFNENPTQCKLQNFEDVFNHKETEFPILIKKILYNKPTLAEAQGIALNIDKYPVIRSTIRANLYLFFIQQVYKAVPATDKVDDCRHVIEASYCDAFITKDRQLLNNIKKINPNIESISWTIFKK